MTTPSSSPGLRVTNADDVANGVSATSWLTGARNASSIGGTRPARSPVMTVTAQSQ